MDSALYAAISELEIDLCLGNGNACRRYIARLRQRMLANMAHATDAGDRLGAFGLLFGSDNGIDRHRIIETIQCRGWHERFGAADQRDRQNQYDQRRQQAPPFDCPEDCYAFDHAFLPGFLARERGLYMHVSILSNAGIAFENIYFL